MYGEEPKRMARVIRDILKAREDEIVDLIEARRSEYMPEIIGSGSDAFRVDLIIKAINDDDRDDVQDISGEAAYYFILRHLRQIERHGNGGLRPGATRVFLIKGTDNAWLIECEIALRDRDHQDGPVFW